MVFKKEISNTHQLHVAYNEAIQNCNTAYASGNKENNNAKQQHKQNQKNSGTAKR